MKKKTKETNIMSEVISSIPYIIYVLVLIPLMGYLSYKAFTDFVNTGSSFNNTIIVLIIIFINLIILLASLYGFNLLTKFKVGKFSLIGGVVLLITLVKLIQAYVHFKDSSLTGAKALLANSDFRTAKGIFIGFVIYYVLTFFINRIAVISAKNKGLKSSR